MVDDSILDTTKKVLGIDAAYKAFDVDILMHINSVFSTLSQLAVGPEDGFFVTDENDTWSQFIQEQKNINSVKTYVFLKVRLLFDPPTTAFALNSMQEQARELEWRLNVQMEGVRHPWVDPMTLPLLIEE